MSLPTTTSTPSLIPFHYVYDGIAYARLLPSPSEHTLPPAYADSQTSTFEQTVCSPPYSPRPLPRPPTPNAASTSSTVAGQSPISDSPVVDLAPLHSLPDANPSTDDVHSFVPSDSDSESDATLHEDAVLGGRPALQLSTVRVIDSTLSPVDPECLSSLDMELLSSPLDAWADVCYTGSLLAGESEDEDEMRGAERDTDNRRERRRKDSRHVFAALVHSPYMEPRVPPKVTSPASSPTPRPFSSSSPCFSRSTPTLASPRVRNASLSLIRSRSPPLSDADADVEDNVEETDSGDPHGPLRHWTPPQVWARHEAWVPFADVEEKCTALHFDLGAREDEKESLKARQPRQVHFNLRPTSPVPGYPLLFSRAPPNPAESVHYLPRCDRERSEGRKVSRERSLSRMGRDVVGRVAGLFR